MDLSTRSIAGPIYASSCNVDNCVRRIASTVKPSVFKSTERTLERTTKQGRGLSSNCSHTCRSLPTSRMHNAPKGTRRCLGVSEPRVVGHWYLMCFECSRPRAAGPCYFVATWTLWEQSTNTSRWTSILRKVDFNRDFVQTGPISSCLRTRCEMRVAIPFYICKQPTPETATQPACRRVWGSAVVFGMILCKDMVV